jgi:hypothetical protein
MIKNPEVQKIHNVSLNPRIPFSELHEPGAYVSNTTGNLFRIPEEALVAGRSPLIEIISISGTMVTKIDENPWIPISKARQLAANADLAINF